MIGIVTAIATASGGQWCQQGLKWLSNINMVLAGALAAFVLLLGPTLFLLRDWVQNLGIYVQWLPQLALRTGPFTDGDWLGSWTIFYWGWWISWAPLRRDVHRPDLPGRTIRSSSARS